MREILIMFVALFLLAVGAYYLGTRQTPAPVNISVTFGPPKK